MFFTMGDSPGIHPFSPLNALPGIMGGTTREAKMSIIEYVVYVFYNGGPPGIHPFSPLNALPGIMGGPHAVPK